MRVLSGLRGRRRTLEPLRTSASLSAPRWPSTSRGTARLTALGAGSSTSNGGSGRRSQSSTRTSTPTATPKPTPTDKILTQRGTRRRTPGAELASCCHGRCDCGPRPDEPGTPCFHDGGCPGGTLLMDHLDRGCGPGRGIGSPLLIAVEARQCKEALKAAFQGATTAVVARSPDRATWADRRFPGIRESSWRPSVRPSGTVRRPCHSDWGGTATLASASPAARGSSTRCQVELKSPGLLFNLAHTPQALAE